MSVPQPPSLTRQILTLALPALGTLIAQPIFVLIDSAMVGHLGTAPLAGLGIASTVLHTIVGIFVFLLFSTTTRAAHAYGRGDIPAAATTGIQATYLAVGIGTLLAITLAWGAPWILSFFNASPQALPHALAYLRVSAPGIVGMFVVMAATGTLRGLHDTTSALGVATAGAALNTGLNALFIYGLDWGVAGSAAGTTITQLLMAVTLLVLLARRAHLLYKRSTTPLTDSTSPYTLGTAPSTTRDEATVPPLRSVVSLRPSLGGVIQSFRDGFPLLVRTIALRVALMAVVWVVTGMGVIALAAHQIVSVVWAFTAYALDSLAVASQTIFASTLGAATRQNDNATTPPPHPDSAHPEALAFAGEAAVASSDAHVPHGVSQPPHEVLRRLTWWGLASGAGIGVIQALLSGLLPHAFSSDPHVWQAATPALLIAAATMPIAGVVFLYDGVMMGADRTLFLAWAGLVLVAVHVPALWAVAHISASWSAPWALGLLWAEFGLVFMGGRAITLWVGSRDMRRPLIQCRENAQAL